MLRNSCERVAVAIVEGSTVAGPELDAIRNELGERG